MNSGFDGFINQDGLFYKIKEIGKDLNDGHYEWAQEYLSNKINEMNIKDLTKMKTLIKENPIIYLIDYEGFVYYSHTEYYVPIVQGPNPRYNEKKVTKEQLDTLLKVMISNNENPFNNDLMMDEKNYYIDDNINRR